MYYYILDKDLELLAFTDWTIVIYPNIEEAKEDLIKGDTILIYVVWMFWEKVSMGL